MATTNFVVLDKLMFLQYARIYQELSGGFLSHTVFYIFSLEQMLKIDFFPCEKIAQINLSYLFSMVGPVLLT